MTDDVAAFVLTLPERFRAKGITVYELARLLGSSVRMIEHHYGVLLDTAHDAIPERLDAVAG